jgi:golgin subfamily B member 1
MPTVREFEQAFQEDPTHEQAFLSLRKAYGEKQRFDKLVTLYESRAQAATSDEEAADLYLQAAVLRIEQLADSDNAEIVLQYALQRLPGHAQSSDRLRSLYREQGRMSDYLTMLEVAAGQVVESNDATRLAALNAELAQVDSRFISPLDQALSGPMRAEITPEALRTVVTARKIHKALGNWSALMRLYDLEISATADTKRKADLLLACAKLLAEKAADLPNAAVRLAEALRIRPGDDRAVELQAWVFAQPSWLEPGGKSRAAALYLQLAVRRRESGDLDGAVSLLRRALAAVPGDIESSDALEKMLLNAGRLKEVDRYYRERTAESETKAQKLVWVQKRAALAQDHLKDEAEVLRVYEELVALEPPSGKASEHLAVLYTQRQNFAKLAELRERQLAVISDVGTRLPLLRELAALYRDRLGDADQAAVYLHAILQLDPADETALKSYGDHFRKRGDFNALIDLLEFAADSATAAGPTADHEPKIAAWLQEVATVAERNLVDMDRALGAWRKLEDLGIDVDQARETQKRLLLKEKRWEGLADLLAREAESAPDDGKRIEVLRKLARHYQDKLAANEKAVATYRTILSLEPSDAAAFRSVVEIFESQQDWTKLSEALRARLPFVGAAEQATLLRRLGGLYAEQLSRPQDAVWAAQETLRLLPGDRDAYFRLEDNLEAQGELPQLVQVLVEHSGFVSEQDRAALLSRAARIMQDDLEQSSGAALLWEQVLELVPGDPLCLLALPKIYTELGRSSDLARILDLQVACAVDDAATQVVALRRLAKLCEDELSDNARALRAWELVLCLVPQDDEALRAVCELYRENGAYQKLADALGMRLSMVTDPSAGVPLALEQAHVFETHLDNPTAAIDVLEQVVEGLDPHNVEAFAILRRLCESQEDWQKVVAVAERQMILTTAHDDKVDNAMEIAAIHRDRLGDPDRAIEAFERVLGLAPQHRPALQALASLYAMSGDAERLVATDEKLLVLTETPIERRRLIFEIADALESSLASAKKAFAWVARAHSESSDDETWTRLESLAKTHSLWEDLIRVHEVRRSRATSPAEQIEVAQDIANIYENRMGAGGRAFGVLRDALAIEPDGSTLLPELERLAAAEKHWQALLDVYMRVARGRPSLAARADLLERRAIVFEERLGDPSAAMDEWLRRFGLDPSDNKALEEILRLAGSTGRWEDALRVYGQLFARATDPENKVELAKLAAAMVEERLKDRVRAFRAYLNAFRLAPDDSQIIAHLWRLASLIGVFDGDAKRVANLVPEVVVEAVGRSNANPDATMHLVLSEAAQQGAFVEVLVEDVTDTLSLDDAEEVKAPGNSKSAPPPPPVYKAPPPVPMPTPVVARQTFDSAWAEFANAYASLPALDNASRRRNLLKIAEVWEKGAQDAEKAFASLERAFKLDPFDQQVRRELERLAEERRAWDQLCEIYLTAVDSSTPTAEAVSLHHDVAAFRERLGQRDLAEERYLVIVNLQPQGRKALDQLEDIYRTQNRGDSLATLLERSRNDNSLPAEVRRRKSVELASLYDQQLDRPYEAIDTLERYLSEFDDEPAGPEDALRMAQLRKVLDDLTRLYGRVNLWVKAASATQRSLDLESQPEPRKQLSLVLARIFEKELAQPAKAADAYESLLEDHPGDTDALAALERLCESLGRFEKLAAVLEQRIANSSGPEKLALVKRRSRVLEDRLGNPDAAAANLRGLGTEMLDDDEIAGALLRNLRRAGLGHEATRLLSQRIERLTENKADVARIVALHLELARLRLDDLNDANGAKQTLESALALSPNHAEALGLLSKVHLKNGDFASFASSRAKEAENLQNAADAAVAFVEAGRVYLDQLEDKPTAKRMFEQAVKRSEQNVEAVRSLAALLSELGQSDQAQQTLRDYVTLEPVAKDTADAMTDLARLVWATDGGVVEAIALLESAIELAPENQAALVSLADIHFQEQQWELAERRLLQSLRRLKPDADGAHLLLERLADVSEKLGRPDDGYRQLQEAEKRDPSRLSVRLALGKNRFNARKWREALAHLENVDAHPEAKKRPDDMGAALAMAGECAVKLKQQEKARSLFERALAYVPTDSRALSLLASVEMEAGKLDQAAGYISRLGANSTGSDEKAALLEQLGDLYAKAQNKDGARESYEAAVALIETPTQAQLALFDKALALQNAAGSLAQAAETSSRLIGLEADPKQRAKRRREASVTLIQHNQLSKAAELLAGCLDDDETDEVALASLVEVQDKLGVPEASLFRLERALPALPPAAEKSQARARRVFLWHRLGQLRLATSTGSARRAFEEVLKIDPTHLPSRESLTALYSTETEADVTLSNHRALAVSDPTRVDSLRVLADAYLRDGRKDQSSCVLEIVSVLGLNSQEELAFTAAHAPRVRKPDEPYAGVIDEPLRKKHLVPPEGATLAEVFSTMWEGGLEIDGSTLESLGVAVADKISPLSEQDIAKLFAEVCKSLDNQKPGLFVAWDPKVTQMEIAVSRPPAVVVPSLLAAEGSNTELRFWLGRTLELTRPENILAATIAPRAFSHLFGSVLKAFHPRHARRRGNDSAEDATAKLKKALPYRVAKRLGELFANMADEPFSSARWREVVEGVGNRAGLVCCGDLNTAARAVLATALSKPAAEVTAEELRQYANKPGQLRDLLRFAQSDGYFALRVKLGLAQD